jgi:hypothetical protein
MSVGTLTPSERAVAAICGCSPFVGVIARYTFDTAAA